MPFSSRLLNTGSLQINDANFDEMSLNAGAIEFNGTTQNLSASSNAAFEFGAGDFTIEVWMYPTFAFSASNICLYNVGSGNFFLQVRSGAFGIGRAGVTENNAFTATLTSNTWQHIAVSRVSGTVYGFLNGVLLSSAANTINYGQSGLWVASLYNGTQRYAGYLSNLRVVNGTGLYTTTFTPPQAILSTTSITPGSIGLNGTNQFLSTPATGSLANNAFFGTGKTFTVEAWIYQTSTISTAGKFNIVLGDASGSTGSNMCWNVGTDSTNTPCIAWYDGSSKQATGSTPLTTNTWNHVAWVSTAGTVTIYVNGVSQSLTGTTTLTNSTQTAGIVVGVDRNSYWGGRITNLRATTTAVYTGNFTPPTAPLVPISGTILLLLANSANTLVTDSSSSPFTITNNNTATFVSSTGFATPVNTTSLLLNVTDSANFIKDNSPNNFTLTNTGTATWIGVGPFNSVTGSIAFNGTNQNLSNASPSTSLTFSTDNFTAEAFVYFTSTGTSYTVYSNGANTNGISMGIQSSGKPYAGIGTVYGVVPEDSVLTLTAGTGYTLTSVLYGNYGSNDATAPNWTKGAAAGSQAAFETYCIGNTVASIPATNAVWGDPAPGVPKSLAVATTYGLAGPSALSANTWHHLAVVRSGTGANQLVFYVNGSSVGSATLATNYGASPALYIGASVQAGTPKLYWPGYITNLRVVDGTAVYTGNFSVPNTALTAVANTTLLLSAASSATLVKDSSTSNLTFTNTGTSTFSNLTPFLSTKQRATADGTAYQVLTQVDEATLTSGSIRFNGTDQYLTLPTSSFLTASNTYTIEFWMYPTSFPTGVQSTPLYQLSNTSGTNFGYLAIGLRASGVLTFSVRPNTGGTEVGITSSSNVTLNAWNHVAASVNGGAATLYINGTSVGTATVVTMNGTQTFSSMGYWNNGFTSNIVYYNGYISNFRIVKATAVYTAAFTPPQSILPAVTGTSLLLNAVDSAQLITDGSPNNFTVTNNGTATWSPTNPFNFGGGGSISFDGTSQYLTVTSPGTAFSMGTGDFTIEAWIYVTSTAAASKQIFSAWASGANSYQFYLRTNNRLVWQIYTQNSPDVAGLAVTPNTWTHVAWSKSGTVAYLFINGVLSDTTTGVTNSANGTAGPYVGGQGAAQFFPGYITNLRVIKGVALYTSSFTPPRQTLKAVSGTSLLLNVLNATNFIKDSSTNNFTMTNTGTATYSSTVAPGLGAPALRSISEGTTETLSDLDEATLSSGSIALNATSYLNPGSNAAFAFGTGNFTIECWFYAFYIGNSMTLLDTRNPDTSNAGWDLTVQSNGKMLFGTNSVAYINNGTTTLAANTWYYISVIRDSTTQIRMFLNGVQEGSTYTASASQNFTNTAFQIGTGANGTANGLITNVRLTKGVALNVQTITQPQSMLTTTANTSILLNVVNSTNFIKDNGPNNFTVTNPAATLATWVNSSPFNQGINGGAINFAQPGGGATVQYLISPASSNLNLGSSNFTAEGWFLSSPYQFDSLNNIIGFRSTSYPFGPFFLCLSSTSTLNLYSSSNGTTWNLANAVSLGTINIGTWNHIALVRNGNSMQAYVNGVATGSAINTTSVTFSQTSAPFTIGGNNYLSNDQFAGLITNVRLVIGTAIYTTNFTVPTAPLTAVSGTQLLLSANTSGTVATDSSTNNFSMTNTGSVGWIGTGPFNGQ